MSDLLEQDRVSEAPVREQACPCGSGLRQSRCCGLDIEQVERTPPEGPYAGRIADMSRAWNEGEHDLARRIAIEVLDTAPGQREALAALFNVLSSSGQRDPAAVIAERLARLYPNDAMLRAIVAQFFLACNNMMQGQFHSRMLIRLAPQAPVAHFTMGRAFLAVAKASAAEHHFRLTLQLLEAGKDEHPSRIDVEAHLATSMSEQGRLDEARTLFERLTREHGPNLAILLAWAKLEESARDFDAAARLLDRAEEVAAGGPRIAVLRAGLHRRTNQPEQALEALQTVEERFAELGGGIGGLLQKGQILDSLGRYDEAFEAFSGFKRQLREAGQTYDAVHASGLVEQLRNFFTEGRARLLPRAETRADSAQPIFIVGFPRSGTTLVEQTLSSHPNIAAGDELPLIASIADRSRMLLGSPVGYPLSLSELWLGDRAGHIDTLRDLYLNEAAQIGALDPAKRWFTDKMPLNETHLGLISLLFPQSPIVHLVRHPLDVVLSVFSNGLTHGFNCASALETAAQHYALIADLILHYRTAMPLNYRAVRYEDIVTDQEREVRGLLDFIGEPFVEETLAFHANIRPARTASYAQVTEKLYDRSRYRYRNYLEHLEPVIPILEPAITRLGYSID